MADVRTMLNAGWRPMEARSCTKKRDEDGRIIAIEVWVKTITRKG